MKRRHVVGLLLRISALVMIGVIIVATDESDAARYSYDSMVIPENSIPKLDRQTYIFLTEYGKQLQNLSSTYGVDWRLALAVLRQESAFNPEAVSDKGAEGFMQLMPGTGLQLASLYNVSNISNPVANIQLGVIHLRNMLRDFSNSEGGNRIQLAVAAYNCGLTRVQDAQAVAEFLGDNPNAWVSIKGTLPLLSVRYAPLQKHIWKTGRPTGGYFGGYDQTLNYVENVMHYYNIYRDVLQRQ